MSTLMCLGRTARVCAFGCVWTKVAQFESFCRDVQACLTFVEEIAPLLLFLDELGQFPSTEKVRRALKGRSSKKFALINSSLRYSAISIVLQTRKMLVMMSIGE